MRESIDSLALRKRPRIAARERRAAVDRLSRATKHVPRVLVSERAFLCGLFAASMRNIRPSDPAERYWWTFDPWPFVADELEAASHGGEHDGKWGPCAWVREAVLGAIHCRCDPPLRPWHLFLQVLCPAAALVVGDRVSQELFSF